MNNSPFSPFVGRRRTVKEYKRRQSELPSDLIDWDAPEIPELDKQRIIYEEYIKECNEDHAIELLINDEIFQVAHEVMMEMVQKQNEDKLLNERSQVNLLLGQIKMFENHSQDLENTIRELENQTKELQFQKENLDFRVKELETENIYHLDTMLQKKAEAEEIKRKWESAKNQLAYYKKKSCKSDEK